MKKDYMQKKQEESIKEEYDFKDIESKIDFAKYQKEEPVRVIKSKKKRLTIFSFASVTTLLIASLALVIIIQSQNSNSQIDFTGTSGQITGTSITNPEGDTGQTPPESGGGYVDYNGYIIDEVKKDSNDSSSGQQGPSKRLDINDIFNYTNPKIYEVTKTYDLYIGLVAAYVDTLTAEQIYSDYGEVMDTECASPLEDIDGTIVKWFYLSDRNYNDNLIKWVEYTSINDELLLYIDGFHLSGIYQKVDITFEKEIINSAEDNLLVPSYEEIKVYDVENEDTSIRVDRLRSSEPCWYAYDLATLNDGVDIKNIYDRLVGTVVAIDEVDYISIESTLLSNYESDDTITRFVNEVKDALVTSMDYSRPIYDYQTVASLFASYLAK